MMNAEEDQYDDDEPKISIAGLINVSSTSDAVFTARGLSLAIEDTLLIDNANIVLRKGHRYGLVGENGAGKTTLMQAIRERLEEESELISVAYVGQNDAERHASVQKTVLDHCMSGNTRIQRIKAELEDLEEKQASAELDEVEKLSERMGEIEEELDAYNRTEPEKRALQTLRLLGFTKKTSVEPVDSLSGGWRTRLELARALFAQPMVLMLDEPTNHLDLHAVLHLASMLRGPDLKNTTLIVVSHDASFLDLVCTDILALHQQRLQEFGGNYAAFEEKAEEYVARHERLYKNRVVEEARQKASIQQAKTRARKSGNDKAIKQAASRERKAEDRVGLYREDGRRYKLRSLKVMDVKAVRLPARAEPVKVGKEITLKLPAEAVAGEDGNHSGAGGMPLIVVEGLSFGYQGAAAPILKNITCSVSPGDRIALVGKNGSGKSTLIKGLIGSSDVIVSGGRGGQGSVHRRGKVALLDQNQIATLSEHLEESSVEFLAKRHPPVDGVGRFRVEGDIRAHLGGFGLSGDTALLPISELSGGLRVRLCLADLFAPLAVPDVLLLDEPTNHLDAETTTALVNALRTFKGAVVTVSHNFGFLLSTCRDLWLCEDGSLKIDRHADEKDFSQNFRQFASQIVSKDDRADLDNVLRNRATRNALVIQGAHTQQASLVV
eukprot:TRINITY_DN1097_c0_g1_i2.p1 TRINITY_DN1097_c0_g1~~TRINITY_DN1097_c0_g1_i2.p1  ORF type:complete len:666 (+),score=127.97 TRINITY_DN1097_c0_g1_i2:217-2214(+)